jgi:tetratricopeptide (TPR) repeat protein
VQGDIKQLFDTLVQLRNAISGLNPAAVNDLEECGRSAQTFVSTANTMYSAKSSMRSEGEALTRAKREGIHGWIPEPTIWEDALDIESDVSPTSPTVTAVSYDREAIAIQTLYRMAISSYENQNYLEAKKFLLSLQERSDKQGTTFKERSQVLKLLALTYCRLQEWGHAENVLKTEFDGRSQVVNRLALCYWSSQKWDDAEKVMAEARDEYETYQGGTAWKYHLLAEIHLAKGNYTTAIEMCDQALQVTANTVGEEHVQFYLSLRLLANIYEAKGDEMNARIHKFNLPNEIEGSPNESR